MVKIKIKNLLFTRVALSGLVIWTAMEGLVACSPAEVKSSNLASTKPQTSTAQAYDYKSNWLNIKTFGRSDKGAPNIILIPGLVSSPDVWNGVIDALGKTHKLHVVGVSGFAGIAPSDNVQDGVIDGLLGNLNTYIQMEGLEHVTIIGHSLGGFTALNMAIEHGDIIDKIIIVDSLPFYSAMFNPAASVDTAKPMADTMRDQITVMDDENFKAMQAGTVRMMSKNEKAQKDILAWSLSSDRATMAKAMHELMVWDRRGDLSHITNNVHVIYAWDEAMRIPVSQIDSIYEGQYKGLKSARLTRIDGSFHFIMKDKPEEFLTAVQTALEN